MIKTKNTTKCMICGRKLTDLEAYRHKTKEICSICMRQIREYIEDTNTYIEFEPDYNRHSTFFLRQQDNKLDRNIFHTYNKTQIIP